ncbi:MAG: hypothetical protein PHU66_02010 [Bacteroidaceae bacterium]|nr:hypothetical protein [Bacteroidaceae bacterium]
MKCELIKIDELSGNKASIYSVIIDEDDMSLFEVFIDENFDSHTSEINNITQRLKTIGAKTGAREHFFKLNEGIPGDGVCALYDDPDKKLRLYCIRYGTMIVVLGGGGPKPKNVRRLQDNEKLTEENYLLRAISKKITEKITDKDIRLSTYTNDFEGELSFEIDY